MFEELAPKVPLLTDVKPNGDTQITQFDAAGGTLGLLKQLAPLLDLSARTVGGTTLGEAVAAAPVDQAVIRPLDAPLATHPAIVVMRGRAGSRPARWSSSPGWGCAAPPAWG
jgi:dihydroxy-acid dehydratase